MEIIFIKIISGLILFIILLFLRELGVLRHIYEEFYTHPSTKTLIFISGDLLYVVGGSVIASVVFTLTTTPYGFCYGTFFVGITFIVLGLYLRKE